MLSTSHDTSATGASSSETQRRNAADDESRQLQLPDAQMPVPLDLSAFNLYLEQGLIRCEICLRTKTQQHFSRKATISLEWHANHPWRARGSTIWKCIECSMAIDNDHRNWQEHISLFGEARGYVYTSVPNQPAEFYLPREADTLLD